jgi:hypothetical protein
MVKVFLSIGPSPRGQGNKASAGTDPKKFHERPSESGFVRYTTGSGLRKAALKCLTLSGFCSGRCENATNLGIGMYL